MKDVVDALLKVGDLRLKPGNQSFCNFAQKHSCLTGLIYVLTVFDTI